MQEQRRRHYLQAMGIELWERRGAKPSVAGPPVKPVSSLSLNTPPMTSDAALMDWDTLERTVLSCTRCALHQTRTQAVFGVGNRQAQWMVIGEAPGADEDRQGEPFVGRAGQLLNEMLKAIGLTREEVYIANVLKCLRYNTPVQLADGSWERVGRLVRSRYAGEVMSVDLDGRLVPRRVTGWHESPLGGRRVYRLTYRGAKNAGASRVCTQLTGDHEVLTRRGFVPVEQLKPGDQIATGQGLSPLAYDVICGSLLGDATLSVHSAYLGFSHSMKQREYALFKAGLLEELKPKVDELAVAAVSGGEKRYQAVMVRTVAHRTLRLLRREFYPSSKRVPAWMANQLNERMLAFWFMDDGYTRIHPGRQPLAEIATCGFPDEDLFILLKALSRLGLQAKAARGRLYFDATATRELSERIAPYVPPAMRYKLHPEIAGSVSFKPGALSIEPARVLYDDVEVKDITGEYRSDRTFFCIDVEETHNFVTAGGVVHNCRPPGNRDPLPEEAATCEPYLKRQIELIKPKIILAVGRIAAQNLLKTDTKIGALRGKRHLYPGTEIPLVVTYHPAYLLRSPLEKRKAWEDLQLARRVAQGGTG